VDAAADAPSLARKLLRSGDSCSRRLPIELEDVRRASAIVRWAFDRFPGIERLFG